jgi:hypothetical protein
MTRSNASCAVLRAANSISAGVNSRIQLGDQAELFAQRGGQAGRGLSCQP